MKRVKLDYQEITITDEAFEQIAAIVKANRVCELCGNPYTPDNPNVELNRCLNCFFYAITKTRDLPNLPSFRFLPPKIGIYFSIQST